MSTPPTKTPTQRVEKAAAKCRDFLWEDDKGPYITVVRLELARALAAELETAQRRIAELEKQRADAFAHYSECAGTPLMKTVLRERDAANAKVEKLRVALQLGITMQGEGDIWSVRPNKMRAFKAAAQTALAETEKV